MKRKDLYDALLGINKDYIEESENFKAISSEVIMERYRKIKVGATAICLVLICIAAIGIGKGSLLIANIRTAEKISLVSQVETTPPVSTKPEESVQITSGNSPLNGGEIAEKNELFYSELVKSTEIPELNGYDSAALLDIMAFDESMLKESFGIVEGEIIDMWVNHYEYATASDKFTTNGRLYHKDSTVVYKIKVDKVFSGDFSVGDIVTIEDYYFMLDSIISIKKGGNYVIPISKGDGILFTHEEVVSGSTILESSYYTLYQFHPQIEKVSGGYIVPDDWKTLITEDCTEIIMDIDDTESSYYGSMYFIPDGVFNDRMNSVL